MRKTACIFILALGIVAWGSPVGALQLLVDTYWADANANHLHQDSIIQVVLFNSEHGQSPSNSDASDNFSTYGSTDPVAGHTDDPTVYIPDSTLDGNKIVYTGHINVNTDNNTASFYHWVDIPNALLNDYDSVYIRVFEATNFVLGEAIASYWGVSTPTNIPDSGAGTGWTWFDNTAITNEAYFEVIPEPTTVALLWLGFGGLAEAARRRKKRCGERTNGASES